MIRTDMKIFLPMIVALTIERINCSPKYDLGGGFVPSSIDFLGNEKKQEEIASSTLQLPPGQSQLTTDSLNSSRTIHSNRSLAEGKQEARFGFTTIGASGTGYGVGSYTPAKVDLGGLILGAVIGVGTILIIPKLLYIISGSYGAYGRSHGDGRSFVNTLAKLDDLLAHHGIDTTSCMQQTVCTFAKRATVSIKNDYDIDNNEEDISSFDKIVNSITTNQIFQTAMQGTAIEEAIERGKTGQNCSKHYKHCGFSLDSLTGLFSNILTSIQNLHPIVSTASTAP